MGGVMKWRWLLAAVFIGLTGAAKAQDYPSRSVRILVGFGPGGAGDLIARVMADGLSARLGRPVVVENRPGAGGNLASNLVAKAAPDGYTLYFASPSLTIAPSVYKTLPFETAKDFTPISEVATTYLMVTLHKSVPANNLAEFIAYAKANPGKLNYASSGNGSIIHLGTALLEKQLGIRAEQVPYQSSAVATTDLIAGRVQMMLAPTTGIAQMANGGEIKALAYAGDRRSLLMPSVPTMNEVGVPFEMSIWSGLFAPAGTPRPIIDRLYREAKDMLNDAAVLQRLREQDWVPRGTDPDSFRRLFDAELARWAQIAKETGAAAE
jgi:tripartite-type tricarboxylate transporter receptor subunit TctC